MQQTLDWIPPPGPHTSQAGALASGKTWQVIVTPQILEASDAIRRVSQPACGGVSMFLGVTRTCNWVAVGVLKDSNSSTMGTSYPLLPGDTFHNKQVDCLAYEAYTAGAVTHLSAVAQQLLAETDTQHIVLAHRVGIVPVQETSLLVVASSAHRRDCQDTVSTAVNLIKAHTPIWKKEIYSDGTCSWKSNCECTSGKTFPTPAQACMD